MTEETKTAALNSILTANLMKEGEKAAELLVKREEVDREFEKKVQDKIMESFVQFRGLKNSFIQGLQSGESLEIAVAGLIFSVSSTAYVAGFLAAEERREENGA